MTDQQDIFDYNTASSMPTTTTPYPFEVQQQQQSLPPLNNSAIENLAPLTEKELGQSNSGSALTPLERAVNDEYSNSTYQYESIGMLADENTGNVPPLTLTNDEGKPNDNNTSTDFTPIIDEIVNQEAGNLLNDNKVMENVQSTDRGTNEKGSEEHTTLTDDDQADSDRQKPDAENAVDTTKVAQQDDEDEENTWSISAIKKMRLFPDQKRSSTNESPTTTTELPFASTPTQELTRDSTDSQMQLKKRRKRIMVDESDESETEEIREEVQKSDEAVAEPSEEPPHSPSPSEHSVDSIEALEQRVEELKGVERPGPWSKKTSTLLLRQIEARTLLQNAVVIPSSKDKKHKKHKKNLNRVLESDDEEQVAPTIKTDLSDIGLFDDDPNQELNRESILVSENMFQDTDFVKLEGITVDEAGVTVPIENPILPEGGAIDNDDDANEKDDDVIELESSSDHEQESAAAKNKEQESTSNQTSTEAINKEKQNGEYLENNQSPTVDKNEKPPMIKTEPEDATTSNNDNDSTTTPPTVKIKQENTDTPLVIKQEPCTTKEAETFLADALRSQFGCDEQSKSSAKKSEHVDPSSTFWGRDSSSSESEDNWPTTSSAYTIPTTKSHKKYGSSTKSKKRRQRYDSDSDDYKRRKRSNAMVRTVNPSSFMRTPAPNALGMRPIMSSQKPATIRVAVRSKEELKRKVKDRFFDRSRLVPSDIYFGDIPVPLHILHAYNSDAFDSSSDSDGYCGNRSGYRQSTSKFGKNMPSNRPMGHAGSSIKSVPIQAYK